MGRTSLGAAVVSLISLGGCAEILIDSATGKHQSLVGQVRLGDLKDDVLPKLESSQSYLPANYRKNPDQYMKDGKEVYIYYARSGRQQDGMTTDDEFTPYVFENGRLTAIGWQAIGGPKSQGRSPSVIVVD